MSKLSVTVIPCGNFARRHDCHRVHL